MRRLILIRHAKSSWSDPDLADHDRPLNQRGRMAAVLMGAWLAERGHRPEVVLCSSSLRTQETAARLRMALPALPEPVVRADLYHADPADMLRVVQATPEAVSTLALIGHQPGLGAFTRRLATADTPASCLRAYQKFPTAACAVLEHDGASWADLAFGAARFVAFAVPRELV